MCSATEVHLFFIISTKKEEKNRRELVFYLSLPRITMKLKPLKRTFGVIFCLFLSMMIRASIVGEEAVVSLTLSDDLTGETVRSVMTDHNGFTWIGTSGGVNVFNGQQMHSFPIVGDNGRTLEVRSLCETQNRCIYAATEAGLYRMCYGTSKFERILPEIKSPVFLLADGNNVYIGGLEGLQIYDGQQLKHVDVDVSRRGIDNIVRQYEKGNDGLIWFLGRFDINSYNPRTGKIVHYPLAAPLNQSVLTQFASIGNGRFVVGTRGNGLYVCDIKKRTAERIEGVGKIVSTVQRSGDGGDALDALRRSAGNGGGIGNGGYICVGTDGAGAYLLEEKGEKLEVREHFHSQGEGRHRLPSNGVYCYYRDANGVNWFGFVRYGLAYTYHCGNLFKPLAAGDFTTEGMNIRTYCRHGDDVALGTQDGFYYVNAKTGAHNYFAAEKIDGAHIVNTIIWYDGRFYIGTFDSGLYEFDPQTQHVGRQTISPLLDNTSIGDLKVGSDGRLWIGCGHGLFIVDKGKIQQHFTEQNSRIVGGLILSITFDNSGNAWLTGRDGCSLYSSRSHEIVDAKYPAGFFNQQPWMRGALGHNGLIFMRTGTQTFYTNEQMTDFGELALPVNFSDKWCRSFVDDMKGHYLLSSEYGVIAIRYDMTGLIHYGHGEGLCGEFINDMGIDKDGMLWVATSQGLFFGRLNQLLEGKGSSQYKVQLYDIRVGSDLLPIDEQYIVNEDHTIRLTWNLTSEPLQTRAVLLDYAKQTNRIYEYQIDGGEWKLVEIGGLIDVRGLLLGRHELKVRLAGMEGSTSSYELTVVPSGWAIFELILLIVSVVLLWLWYNYRKQTEIYLTERDEIEDALIESEELRAKSEELAAVLEEPTEKYQKVKVDEEECAAIVERMKEYIERERVYTDIDFKMKDLADVLHLSTPKLSQVFNIYLNEKYYDFINRYRLDEFKRLIEAGEYKRFTITALSEQCGFKKSNFFSTFRKIEGMTPAEYLKKQGIKL